MLKEASPTVATGREYRCTRDSLSSSAFPPCDVMCDGVPVGLRCPFMERKLHGLKVVADAVAESTSNGTPTSVAVAGQGIAPPLASQV